MGEDNKEGVVVKAILKVEKKTWQIMNIVVVVNLWRACN